MMFDFFAKVEEKNLLAKKTRLKKNIIKKKVLFLPRFLFTDRYFRYQKY